MLIGDVEARPFGASSTEYAHAIQRGPSMSSHIYLLVDSESLADDPELSYLLSFTGVGGVRVEEVAIIGSAPAVTHASVGQPPKCHVSLEELPRLRQLVGQGVTIAVSAVQPSQVDRAVALSWVAAQLGADAVAAGAAPAWAVCESALGEMPPIVTVAGALAMLGAFVRQRDPVALGGTPPMTQVRAEVYPLTARLVLPNGQAWWSACVWTIGGHGELLDCAGAVIDRIGQALRGRDAVHEALRKGRGRAAVLDALYHLDVVLMSGVGSLDALARVANEVFQVKLKGSDVGWQKPGWLAKLSLAAGPVAAVVQANKELDAAFRTLIKTRNTIHSIPLGEMLHVHNSSEGRRSEHRVMLSSELARDLGAVWENVEPSAPLSEHGVFLNGQFGPFVNLGQFTEQLLTWTTDIANALMVAMLACPEFKPGERVTWSFSERRQNAFCTALARIGAYPSRRGPVGLPPEQSTVWGRRVSRG